LFFAVAAAILVESVESRGHADLNWVGRVVPDEVVRGEGAVNEGIEEWDAVVQYPVSPNAQLPTLPTAAALVNVGKRTYCFNPMRCQNGADGIVEGRGPPPSVTGDDSQMSVGADDVDCSRPMMKFIWHSGYGNQLQAFRHALVMAVYLNRTLLVPPVLPHYELTGGCGGQTALRSNGLRAYHSMYKKQMLSALNIFDLPLMSRMAHVVPFEVWESKCVPSGRFVHRAVDNELFNLKRDGYPVSHHCKSRPHNDCNAHKGMLCWGFPHAKFDPATGVMQTDLAFKPNTFPPLPGTNAAESIPTFQQATDTILDFGSTFATQLFDMQHQELAAHHVAAAMRYRPEMWGVACRLSRKVSPYISNHVRGGDSSYQNSKHGVSVETAALNKFRKTLELLTDELKVRINRAPCPTAKGDKGEVVGKVIRLLVVTDLSLEKFAQSWASTDSFQTLSKELAFMVGKTGWGWKIAITRESQEVTDAINELQSKWYLKHTPGGFVPLVLDIMMAVLADYGFIGNPRSTLSHHIQDLRDHNTRESLCASHDAVDDYDSGCPATVKTGMDKETLIHDVLPSKNAPGSEAASMDAPPVRSDWGNTILQSNTLPSEPPHLITNRTKQQYTGVAVQPWMPGSVPGTVARCIEPGACGSPPPSTIAPRTAIPGAPWLLAAPIDCNTPVLQFVWHSGWGNQLMQLQFALLLGVIMNRTVLVPPILAHTALSYGTCHSRKEPSSAGQMRSKGYKAYRSDTGTSALDVLDISLLQRVAPVMSWKLWDNACRKERVTRFQPNHSCKDGFIWSLPPDVTFNTDSGALIMPAGDLTQIPLQTMGWNASKDDFAEQLDILRTCRATLMDFGSSLLPPQIYDEEMKILAYRKISGAMSYRSEMWGVACRLSRHISPYVATHVRGGDGKFKRENHMDAMSVALKEIETSVHEFVAKGGLKIPIDCPGKEGQAAGWAVRLLVVTDLSSVKFRVGVGSKAAFQDVVDEVNQTVGVHGFRAAVSLTRSAETSAALYELRKLPCMQNIPNGFAELALDVMLAVLAEVGFAGRAGSTLSNHINTIRKHFNRNDLCTAHDAKDGHAHHCPAVGKSDMDLPHEPRAVDQPSKLLRSGVAALSMQHAVNNFFAPRTAP
jgi:hypothetical protein